VASDLYLAVPVIVDTITSNFSKVLLDYRVFNATCNNISFISWQSLLMVEETGLPGENYLPAANS
jgi:hypothetical protein